MDIDSILSSINITTTFKTTGNADVTLFQSIVIKAHAGPGCYSELFMSWGMPGSRSTVTLVS